MSVVLETVCWAKPKLASRDIYQQYHVLQEANVKADKL